MTLFSSLFWWWVMMHLGMPWMLWMEIIHELVSVQTHTDTPQTLYLRLLIMTIYLFFAFLSSDAKFRGFSAQFLVYLFFSRNSINSKFHLSFLLLPSLCTPFFFKIILSEFSLCEKSSVCWVFVAEIINLSIFYSLIWFSTIFPIWFLTRAFVWLTQLQNKEINSFNYYHFYLFRLLTASCRVSFCWFCFRKYNFR